MDIIGIGYMGFETTKLDEWRDYGPNVMGFGVGRNPERTPIRFISRSTIVAIALPSIPVRSIVSPI